jgi:serine protease AprX
MRKVSSVVAASLLVLVVVHPASAAPRRDQSSGPSGGQGRLADSNGNRISDAFQPSLDSAASGDRFDVVVTYSGSGSAATAQQQVGSFPVSHEYKIVHGFAGTMTASQIRALSNNPHVRRIEQDIAVRLALDASRRDFGIDHARADYPGATGAGAAICILDTGLDATHEQFDTKTVTFKDFVGTETTPYDDHGHGTHVANIAAGDGTGGANAATFRGVAPGSALFVGKVLDSAGSGNDSQIIAGIQWCASQSTVRVISMSIGTLEPSDGLDALSQAVNNAVAANGKVAVIAAGNSGDLRQTVGSPGAAANAITVGAVAEWSAPVNAGAGRHSDGVYLAPFSSRGPTLSNVVKPDVTAPGVTVTAAMANQAGGATYATYSGTSMATPFVAGTAALALATNPSLTPSQVRSLIEGTAQDRGPAGKDNDWGAGLLDGYAVVAKASGLVSPAPTPFPTWTRVNGSVNTNGLWSYHFAIAEDALNVPIAGTIVLNGQPKCYYGCLFVEWDPDLDARLKDPTGAVIAESTCALGDECGAGRQETVHAMPTVAGTYTIEVYPYSGGGQFSLDLSRGPVGSGSPPPNQPPVANAGTDKIVSDSDGNGTQAVAMNGSASFDADGTIASYVWSEGGTQIATGPTPSIMFAVGTHAVTLTVTDDGGAAASDQVNVTVNPNVAPSANAGPDQSVVDADGNGSQAVTLSGSGTDPDGTIASYAWTEGGSTLATGSTPSVTLAVGTHTVTLTVTDNGTATASDQVMITVTPPSPTPTIHVGDIDGASATKKGGWTATVTLTVHNSSDAPLSGVVVTGSWSDGTTASCTTGVSGTCTLPVKNLNRKATSIGFTVSSLSRSGYSYLSSANHDPDGDSNGSSIVVNKP